MLVRILGVAVLVAAAATWVPASAADLGGDCCADLEERVAELEATTARKGNRKVSLTVSGHVNEGLMFWDDGIEENVYQVTGEYSRTRVRFRGGAKITEDWYAKYRLEIGFRSSRQSRVDAFNDDVSVIDLRYSEWTLGNKKFGQVTVGQSEDAVQDVTQVNLGGHNIVARADVLDWNANFDITQRGGVRLDREWRDFVPGESPGDGDRGNNVRYDTPTIAGFRLSASWGEDDVWAVGMRFSESLGDFKVAARAGFRQTTDDGEFGCQGVDNPISGNDAKCNEFGASASVLHTPSGLFVTGAYGIREHEARSRSAQTDIPRNLVNDDDERFYVSAGIYKKWFALGKTSIYGEYSEFNNGTAFGGNGPLRIRDLNQTGLVDAFLIGSDFEIWGVGVVQKIDAAAMEVYLGYRNYEIDVLTDQGKLQGLEDWQGVFTGARIKF